ncbi:Mpo1-like protein [Aliikangiella maris]|uniref:Mpo1-like protein n=2 Tax=Aliikangiella maris TaxID=3162458 RepID=A0ABV2BYV9_9GAMM
MKFYEELKKQRWDDHRYYHHNRINQFLHLISATCFLTSYVLLFIDPVSAVMIGWLLAMILRQIGHFFFEPKTYDQVNEASHEFKESIKVGYNLRRKVILLSVWVIAPVILYYDSTMLGMLQAREGINGYLYNLSLTWLFIGMGALVFRTVHLFFIMGFQSGCVWFTKILTDPFHDIKIYHKAPYYIMKGEMYDDMSDWYDEKLVAQKS